MASRNVDLGSTTTVSPSLSFNTSEATKNESGSSSGSKTYNETTANMDEQGLAALMNLIQTLVGGGSTEQKADAVKIEQTRQLIQGLLGQYTTGAAMNDAKQAMAYNLQNSLEANMPSIQKAIEGAGASAGSMQGLLSQKLANDSALAAGSLGAEQAKSYAGTTADLVNTLASLLDPSKSTANTTMQQAIEAFNILKGAVVNRSGNENSSATSQSSSTSYQSGSVFNPGSTTVQTPNLASLSAQPGSISNSVINSDGSINYGNINSYTMSALNGGIYGGGNSMGWGN